MKLKSLTSGLSPVFALLVLSGCNTAYQEAFSRAKEAALRGDFITAGRSYRAACAAAPNDQDACSRVPVFAQKGTEQALASATPACEAGDLDRCLPPLLDGKDLTPDHPAINAMLDKASALHIERCAKWDENGPVSVAVAGLACLQARGHQLPVSGFQSLVASRAHAISQRLSGLAATATEQGTQGAATVLLSAAQCLAPESNNGPRAQQARDAFYAQSAIPVDARISGTVPRRIAASMEDVCPRLASGLPVWARCVESGTTQGQPEPLQLQVEATMQRVQASVSEHVENLRYVSGTRHVRNPQYDEIERRLRRNEKAAETAMKEKRDKERACEKPEEHPATCVGCENPAGKKQHLCDEAERARADLLRRGSEVDAARNELAATPERVREDVWETFTYPILTHAWTAGFSFNLRANTPGAAQAGQGAGELRFEDQEHVGFGPANLPADPLVVPPDQAFADAFLQQLAPHMVTALQRDAQVRSVARQAQCASLPADWSPSWVQCWAEAALWGTGAEPAPAAFLQVLASSAGAMEQPLCR